MMTRPEPIGPVLVAREARALRAAERWSEANDLQGCPLDLLGTKAMAEAAARGRDLTPEELDTMCKSTVASYLAEEEQRLAQEAIASAREEERLAYLRRRQADYRQGLAGGNQRGRLR